jgi:hypothetical protein
MSIFLRYFLIIVILLLNPVVSGMALPVIAAIVMNIYYIPR